MLLKMLKYYCSKMVCIHLMISKYSSIVHFDKLNSLDDGCSRVVFRFRSIWVLKIKNIFYSNLLVYMASRSKGFIDVDADWGETRPNERRYGLNYFSTMYSTQQL